MAQLSNTINYIELPARDLAATQRFYADVFGWHFVDYGPTYTSFEGAGIDGGFTTDTEVIAEGGVLVVLYHEELEACAERVRNAGAAITREIFAFPGGRRFHFADPNGNQLAVWSE